jgi:hypothetical protein
MGRNGNKVDKWREKMEQYRASVTRDKFIADLKKAGFSVKNDIKKKERF